MPNIVTLKKIQVGEKHHAYFVCTCGAKAPNTSRCRGRFKRRHPALCKEVLAVVQPQLDKLPAHEVNK